MTRHRILLTGKTGQVGYELERSLQGLGEIIALDRTQMNLSNLAQARSVIRELKPNLIINPAAYTAVDKAESEPELATRINGEAPTVMAGEAAKLGAAMMHYSTDYVFDGTKTTPYLYALPGDPPDLPDQRLWRDQVGWRTSNPSRWYSASDPCAPVGSTACAARTSCCSPYRA